MFTFTLALIRSAYLDDVDRFSMRMLFYSDVQPVEDGACTRKYRFRTESFFSNNYITLDIRTPSLFLAWLSG